MQCDCGHKNASGAQLCERCGKPLTTDLDMRYDGAVIRSKTKKKTFIDKIWALFANVKFGVLLIVLTLVAAALGTLLPQVLFVDTSKFVSEREAYTAGYGVFGTLYYDIGLADLYNSWWFQTLVLALAASIIIASIDRGVPLFKTLYNQHVVKHDNFLKRQRFTLTVKADAMTFDEATAVLTKKRYRVRTDGDSLLAEKGRFARWGPYINHVGLIIFLSGIMLRLVPGFYVDEEMWVREGDTTAIPGAPGYYVKNNEFILETYDGERVEDAVNSVAKKYETQATLYKGELLAGDTANLERVSDVSIEVNHPAKFDGYALYQMDYRLDELKTMTFQLNDKTSGRSFGDVTIDLANPQPRYTLNGGASVTLDGYYPDFDGFDGDGAPHTKSPNPNNPAFLFTMYTPKTPQGETSFTQIQKTTEPLGETRYKMTFKSAETRDITGLKVRKDVTMPILLVGGIIFMCGLMIGSYMSHRRIWVKQTAQGFVLAAHANKAGFAFKKELRHVSEQLHVNAFHDKQEKEGDDDAS